MYYYLNGRLALVEGSSCVVDCGGVGYKLTVSLITANNLASSEGKTVKLFTHLAVREDGIELFGFETNEEKLAFNMLTGVSGVGPKAAMNILSVMTPDRLAIAVCQEDTKAIAKAPNIGAKTAARIVLELKDKIAKGSIPAAREGSLPIETVNVKGSSNLSEAAEALAVLGYDKASINNALGGINPAIDPGSIIREALKKLSR